MPDLRLPSLTRPSTLAILLAWLAPLAASPVARGAVRGAVRAAPTMQSGERIAAAIGIKAPAVPEGPQPGMGQQKRLHALTQQLVRLPTRSSSDDVGEILAGQHIVERNFTTLLLNLKRKRKWRVATNLAEWAYQQEPPLRLTTLQYNLLISACARSAPRRALAVFRQMQRRCRPPPPAAARRPPPRFAHHPPTFPQRRRVRRRLVQLGDLGGVSRGGRRGGARDLRRDARVRRRADDDLVQLGDRRVRKGGGVAARARALPGDGGVRRRAEHGDVHRRDQRVRRGDAARQGDDALHVHGGGGRAAQLGHVRGGDQRVHAQRAVGARPPPLRGNGCKGRGRRHGAASRDARTAASRTVPRSHTPRSPTHHPAPPSSVR